VNVLTAFLALTGASWQVFRRFPRLIWFPILSIVSLVAVASLIPQIGPSWLYAAILTYVVYLVGTFYAVALTTQALAAMRGGTPRIAAGMAVAFTRMPAIATLAVVSGVVGFALTLLGRSRARSVRIARFLLGTAWSVATYLAVPVLVEEQAGGVASLRRAGALFKKTWGETLLAEVGMRVLFTQTGILLGLIATILFGLLGDSALFFLIMVAIVLTAIGVLGAFDAITRSALYLFAVSGKVPEPFSGADLAPVFVRDPNLDPDDNATS
jgi:hypothetical protein